MENSKLKLNEILAACDLDAKYLWDQLSTDQRKSVVFFTLNRYLSNVNASREAQEHACLVVNERFNKHLFEFLNKHPKLCWQLACSCASEDQTIKFHPWIKIRKEKNKRESFLADLFPNMKREDISTLAAISTDKEIKKYCEDLGWDKKAINGIKL